MSAPAQPSLRQLNAAYDALQDRIVLSVSTTDAQAFRFWITRRFTGLLWPALMKMADAFISRKAPGDPLLRNTLAELAHGEAVGQADFSTPYENGSLFPLGEEPILLARISVEPLQGNAQTMTLLPQQGQGINLELDEKLVHVLARLLQEAATAAEWGLSLRVAPGESTAEAGAPRRLH